jgi:hypothetical protein
MSDYAESRIKEALRINKGNATRARQQVIAWTFEDAKLLHALTQHYLGAIVAYHMERVTSGRSEKSKAPPPKKPKTPAPKLKGDKFGMEILKAVADSHAEVFGLESPSAARKRGQASQQHIDALTQMASKSKTKPASKKKK